MHIPNTIKCALTENASRKCREQRETSGSRMSNGMKVSICNATNVFSQETDNSSRAAGLKMQKNKILI